MVGQDTQARQRLLKAEMVKSGHGGHYKKGPCRAQQGEQSQSIVIATSRRESQQNK